MSNIIPLRRKSPPPTAGWSAGALLAIELMEYADEDGVEEDCCISPAYRRPGTAQRDIVGPILTRLTDDDMRAGFAAMLSHILSTLVAMGGVPNPEWLELWATLPADQVDLVWERRRKARPA